MNDVIRELAGQVAGHRRHDGAGANHSHAAIVSDELQHPRVSMSGVVIPSDPQQPRLNGWAQLLSRVIATVPLEVPNVAVFAPAVDSELFRSGKHPEARVRRDVAKTTVALLNGATAAGASAIVVSACWVPIFDEVRRELNLRRLHLARELPHVVDAERFTSRPSKGVTSEPITNLLLELDHPGPVLIVEERPSWDRHPPLVADHFPVGNRVIGVVNVGDSGMPWAKWHAGDDPKATEQYGEARMPERQWLTEAHQFGRDFARQMIVGGVNLADVMDAGLGPRLQT